eukprot:CAMPEP_0196789038 /NCGR_PEP_ID=MMETSP1104-20130614/25941_1 /TAXON_ID=33652 /ORGANISM="Cafeteria sp., Strain Caron Lab Isolate" /LENGTH=53 /DNA_ID=CAMNT_0042159389 /DNA_START=140 /DNA_END=298 /DNA_ORIENTATION=-
MSTFAGALERVARALVQFRLGCELAGARETGAAAAAASAVRAGVGAAAAAIDG